MSKSVTTSPSQFQLENSVEVLVLAISPGGEIGWQDPAKL